MVSWRVHVHTFQLIHTVLNPTEMHVDTLPTPVNTGTTRAPEVKLPWKAHRLLPRFLILLPRLQLALLLVDLRAIRWVKMWDAVLAIE